MKKLLSLILLFTLNHLMLFADERNDIPVSYKGRFRPLEAYSRLWLYETYHKDSIKNSDLDAFGLPNAKADTFLWYIHLLGHQHFDKAPLFWIGDQKLKKLLNLDPTQDRYSYQQLKPVLINGNDLPDAALELQNALHRYNQLTGPLPPHEAAYESTVKKQIEEGYEPKEIGSSLDAQFPITQRLHNAGSDMLLLPSINKAGAWYSLRALNLKIYDPEKNQLVPIPNFTAYSNEEFSQIRHLYWELQESMNNRDPAKIEASIDSLSTTLMTAFQQLSGKPYTHAYQKSLFYPTAAKLKAERIYYQLPLIGICIALYAISALLLILDTFQTNQRIFKAGIACLIIAFALHSLILIIRCFVLSRPPVSNMFETVIYVPWIGVLISLILATVMRQRWSLIASSLLALILLVVLKITNLNSQLENVQAVLDSQFWLIIHVLMVVGSYGMFALAGILGHIYLGQFIRFKEETLVMRSVAKTMLHTIYLGTALLIPGTILGGIWAAQSWGRFWDWDPKESWAFISSCVYLMWIHAYRFNHIANFGLAIGSIVGLLMISFTWYGVNYILGTGLHSYGFGTGGEIYYYFYIACELTFIAVAFKETQGTKTTQRTQGT